jgi:hypothetical protein
MQFIEFCYDEGCFEDPAWPSAMISFAATEAIIATVVWMLPLGTNGITEASDMFRTRGRLRSYKRS